MLTVNDIEAVADVRSLQGSRRYPQFNAEALALSLPESGIGYVPMKQLGGRRKVHRDSLHTVWRHPAFRGYADYMDTSEFTRGIDDLLTLARVKRTAIMCAEAVWLRCHRSMISDYLKAEEVNVQHIMDRGNTVTHPFTSAATIRDGKLFYEAAV